MNGCLKMKSVRFVPPIYQSLLERLGKPAKVFEMLYARPYYFNRRLGNGISVFNPGDRPLRRNVILNQMLQAG